MAEQTKSNSEILKSFRETRNTEDFRKLYRKYTPVLYRVAYRFLGNEYAAEGAVQESWLRAVEHLDHFEGKSTFQTWLTGIVINCCRESQRHGRRFTDSPSGHKSAGIQEPENLHRKLDLEEALQQLPSGYREILILHDVEGFSHREIASLLDIREGTSKSQLSRSRSAARTLLEDYCNNKNEVNND